MLDFLLTFGLLEEDGGHHSYTNDDLPKEIVSDELISFSTAFDYEDPDGITGKYIISAGSENGRVKGSYQFIENNDDLKAIEFLFDADTDLLNRIDRLIKDNDIALLNGTFEKIDGIPDEYGYEISAVYASDERLSAYDNSSNALPETFMKDLISLFEEASGANDYYNMEDLQRVYYHIYEPDVYSYWASIYEDYDGTIKYVITMNDHKNPQTRITGTADKEIMNRIQDIYEKIGNIETYPRREINRHVTLELGYGRDKVYIRSNTNISDKQLDLLCSIESMTKELINN